LATIAAAGSMLDPSVDCRLGTDRGARTIDAEAARMNQSSMTSSA
jgi:hypothetical protein